MKKRYPIVKSLLNYTCVLDPVVNRLSILSMHFHSEDVPQRIRAHLEFLRDERTVLPLSESLSLLDRGIRLPRGAVSIVVDDAVELFHKTGWVLFAELQLPITLALIPGLIPSHRREHVMAKLMRIAGHEYYLPQEEMLKKALSWIGQHHPRHDIAKRSFNRLFQIACRLPEGDLHALLRYLRCDKASKHRFMSWDSLRELQRSGNVFFASHSMSHPRMCFASDEWLEWEVKCPVNIIKDELGVDIDTFVYPYSNRYAGTSSVTRVLRESGFRYAILTKEGTIGKHTDRYHLCRFNGENKKRFLLYASPAIATGVSEALAGVEKVVGFMKRLGGTARGFMLRSRNGLRAVLKKPFNYVIYSGSRFHCPICKGSFRKMKPFVGSYYIKGNLVDHYTRNAICPKCNSKIRHRLMFTFLLRHTNLLRSKVRLLHFAPEKGIRESLKKQRDIDYVSCDIEPSRYYQDTVKVDACDIQFSDESFDAVISSHVLDAIPDDTKALREICRILRPGGWALIAIPVYGDRTFEDPSLDDRGRQRMYGTRVHQRLNGLDFKAKLVDAGFSVQVYSPDEVPGDYVERGVTSPHIESDKYLFFGRKPAVSSYD